MDENINFIMDRANAQFLQSKSLVSTMTLSMLVYLFQIYICSFTGSLMDILLI